MPSTPISAELLDRILNEALDEFFRSELKPLLAGVSERSLCASLARHLHGMAAGAGLEGYIADVEYNRNHGKVKTYLDETRLEEITIVCDLLLHSRGLFPTNDNLIAIEMKKVGRPEFDIEADRRRLRAMTKPADQVWAVDQPEKLPHVCGYLLGVLVLIDGRHRTAQVECFIGGVRGSVLKTRTF